MSSAAMQLQPTPKTMIIPAEFENSGPAASILSPSDVAVIRSSFLLLQPHARVAGLTFYRHLFGMDPSLRGLFHHNIEDQSANLMEMLGSAVGLLEQPAVLHRVLLSLGRRHAGYGVEDRHYETVGAALLKTLAECLGGSFTTEVKNGWAAIYAIIAQTMQRGGASAPAHGHQRQPHPTLHQNT
jgi:hemoglobin-like flavoprotein